MAIVLSGKELSEQLTQEQKSGSKNWQNRASILALPSYWWARTQQGQIYVRNKGIACETIGIHSVTIRLDADISQEDLKTKSKN